ncbi:MAG TPA: ABC transporter permease [Acidobacteriaceae bacterium]|nr:ABC transporter permease [Acidobacteriaceae bacterium]
MKAYTREMAVGATILVLMAILAFGTHGYFTRENLTDLFLDNMPVMFIAVGMTLVILTGQIDISVGSVFAICSVTLGLLARHGLGGTAGALAACLAGAACGALNGALVAYVRVPSIVVTLATMVAFRDGLRWQTQGSWVGDLPPDFQWLSLTQTGYTIAAIGLVALVVAGAAAGLRYLRAGRAVYATGSNEAAARIAGISTERVVFSVFLLTGALAGLAATMNSVRFHQIPSNSGLGLEMTVIAAVAVGGAAITGGSGTILGTALGVVLLGSISSALTFLGVSAYWEKAIQGAIILSAVTINVLGSHRSKNEIPSNALSG